MSRERIIPFFFFLSFVLAGCGTTKGVEPAVQEAIAITDVQHTETPSSQVEEQKNTASPNPVETPAQKVDEYTFAGTIPAPDFPSGLDWLNTDKPISISQDLRRKIVVLDFWTLGCINCIHIIPDLKQLEEEFADSLVVIGVHSAKFQTEGQTESIRQSILRYGLEHPVVNDQDFTIWNTFGARAWPTLLLIDPLGRVVGLHSGEGVYEVFKPVLEIMDNEFRANGLIDTRPLKLVLEDSRSAPTVLSFPGKILADEVGEQLFIADSNHNRILVSDFDGALQYAIGSGAVGFEDGEFSTATFFRPQGMALSPDGNTLYIADLENHAIRAADLVNQKVKTIAGTGEQAYQYPNGVPGLSTALSSPWDLLLDGDNLHIAMSGLHQLWVHDLAADSVEVFAGSGREGIVNGRPEVATLAQPSGYTTDGTFLYFTDPETSAIRRLPLDGSGKVETIIGTGLFDFGDVDGTHPNALLQHALGVAFEVESGLLYVADTYNHKIKIVDPEARSSNTWIGTGEIGWQDGEALTAKLAEPSGLSIVGSKLYIADTNNHLIRVADLATGELSTLALSNLEIATITVETGTGPTLTFFGTQTVGTGEGLLKIIFTVPEGYKFNELGPFTLTWTTDGKSVVTFNGEEDPLYKKAGPEFPLVFPVTLSPGETTIHVDATAYYCRSDEEELCLVQDVAIDLPLIVSEGSVGSDLEIVYALPTIDL